MNDSLRNVFSHIYEKKEWGDTESVSGPGSTLDATKTIRKVISMLLTELEIDTMLDIPCGDFNWMRRVYLRGTHYIGADIVPELIESNRRKYPDVDFRVMDIVNDELPKVDLILARDVLVHFPYGVINKSLPNIINSGSRYLLTTSFPSRRNGDIEIGQWRPLNLQASPFYINPEFVFLEGCTEGGGHYWDKSLILIDLNNYRNPLQ